MYYEQIFAFAVLFVSVLLFLSTFLSFVYFCHSAHTNTHGHFTFVSGILFSSSIIESIAADRFSITDRLH